MKLNNHLKNNKFNIKTIIKRMRSLNKKMNN